MNHVARRHRNIQFGGRRVAPLTDTTGRENETPPILSISFSGPVASVRLAGFAGRPAELKPVSFPALRCSALYLLPRTTNRRATKRHNGRKGFPSRPSRPLRWILSVIDA